MAGGVIQSDNTGLAEVRNLHGGGGRVLWKRLATGNMMFSDVDSFEFAVLPPGDGAGEHIHTRTEELYFIISGQARLTLGDDEHILEAGDVVLTPLWGRHSIFAVGEEPVEMLIIETLPPEIVERLPSHSPSLEGDVR